MEAHYGAQERRLASSIGPDERRHATRLERAGQGGHDRQGAMSQLQMVQMNGRHHRHRAQATASQTQAIIIAAKPRRPPAPAIGESGSTMVTV